MTEMKYYDFGYLLNAVGFDKDVVFNKDYEEAETFLKGLGTEHATVIRDWLVGFAGVTHDKTDSELALELSKMKDNALMRYFSELFSNFWC